MAGIKDYSTTQANNTDLNGINTAEGMLPSNLNNAIRALMKNTREWFNDSQWVEYGDGDAAFTAAYASATSFTIAGVDVTAIYHASRRIKLTATTPGTIYGTISSSSFSTNTTVNVTWDSGSLSNEAITNVYIGALSKTNSSIPTGIIGTTNIDDDAVTTAKIADGNITVAKMAVNSVDSDQYVDGSIDTVHIADSNITVAKMAANSVDSDQYVDGSIDTAHIGDDQITTAKIPDSAITSAKIADGAIVDADINASAAISLSKLENLTTARALVSDGSGDVSVSDVTSTEVGYLDGVSSAIQTQIDAKQASDADLTAIAALAKTDGNLIVGNGSTWVAESGATARTSLGLGTISTQASDNVSLTGGSITGLGEPSSNSDASTKSYVDQAVAGLRTRTIAECASTANVVISSALEAGDTIDGVTLVAGDRVLLKDQSTATENGLYIAVASAAGAASRDPEHDTIAELSGGMVVVNQGTANDNKIFLCTTDSDGSLGSTSITYTVITPSNSGTVTSIATGTGIDGGTITSTGTISIDSTVATLAGTQTFTNKTLTSPKINEDVAVTSTATELNKLDALSRGSILYGNASAVTTVLTKGTAGKILTSDGTDIAWSDPAAVADNSITLAKMASGTDGNIISYDASGNPVAVATGSDGQVLTSAGAGQPPAFEAVTVADNAITLAKMASGTDGNIISYDTSGNPVAVATGSSGQILTSAGAGAVPSFQTPAGGGKILQVVNVTKTNKFTTTTALGSFANITGMSVAITPSATSSKILVLVNCVLGQGNGSWGVGIRMQRAGSSIYIGDSSGSATRMLAGQGLNTGNSYQVGAQILDSPNTTSATTYQLQLGTESGGTAQIGGSYQTGGAYHSATASSITLLEIGA